MLSLRRLHASALDVLSRRLGFPRAAAFVSSEQGYLQVLREMPSSRVSSQEVAQSGQSARVSQTGRSCGVQLHSAEQASGPHSMIV